MRVHVHICPRCWKHAPGKPHSRRRAAFRRVPSHCRYMRQGDLLATCPLIELLAKYSQPAAAMPAPAVTDSTAGEEAQ